MLLNEWSIGTVYKVNMSYGLGLMSEHGNQTTATRFCTLEPDEKVMLLCVLERMPETTKHEWKPHHKHYMDLLVASSEGLGWMLLNCTGPKEDVFDWTMEPVE